MATQSFVKTWMEFTKSRPCRDEFTTNCVCSLHISSISYLRVVLSGMINFLVCRFLCVRCSPRWLIVGECTGTKEQTRKDLHKETSSWESRLDSLDSPQIWFTCDICICNQIHPPESQARKTARHVPLRGASSDELQLACEIFGVKGEPVELTSNGRDGYARVPALLCGQRDEFCCLACLFEATVFALCIVKLYAKNLTVVVCTIGVSGQPVRSTLLLQLRFVDLTRGFPASSPGLRCLKLR